MDELALTVSQVVERTRIGRNRVYQAIEAGELRAVRIGRRIVVPVAAVHEWLGQLSTSTAAR